MTTFGEIVESITHGEICEECRLSTSGQCVKHTPGVTVTTIPFTFTPFQFTPFFVPQGWQCPCCRRVYAPFMSMCPSCSPPVVSFVTTTTSTGVTDG